MGLPLYLLFSWVVGGGAAVCVLDGNSDDEGREYRKIGQRGL